MSDNHRKSSHLAKRVLLAAACSLLLFSEVPEKLHAAPAANNPPALTKPDKKTELSLRRDLYDKIAVLTGIPWYDLAAVDQYERTILAANKRTPSAPLIAITFSDAFWAGAANPSPEGTDEREFALFGGSGRDADGDGRAERTNDMDVLYTMASTLLQQGVTPDEFPSGLMDYYHNQRSVQRIVQFSEIYRTFDKLELSEHAFPLPLGSDYSYRSTWGASRSWGGRRIHEGTDIFAGYGVPVRSTGYGIIELKGWNQYGGWRIGVRDLNNVYHYFAHLSGYVKDLKEGDVVKPGQPLGRVGSSGYGKPGTSGKFPPHLHYGLYRDGGKKEWSFDPYPSLVRWEREELLRTKKK